MPQTFDSSADRKKTNSIPHSQLSKMIEQGRSFSGKEKNCFYLNTGKKGKFSDISFLSGVDFPDDGRAVASVDWDQDGDLDLFISNRNAPRIRYLRNDLNNSRNSISISLKGNGITCNTDAIGARVEITVGGRKIIKGSRAGEGFLAQSSNSLHFGLGNITEEFKAVVRWPDRAHTVEIFEGLSIGEKYLFEQGKGVPIKIKKRLNQENLKPSKPQSSPSTRAGRIPTIPLLSGTELKISNPNGGIVATGNGKPSLVFIWASWCNACLHKIEEITKKSDEIRAVGLQIIALNVDHISTEKNDSDKDIKLLKKIKFPFASARANNSVLNALQENHDIHVGLNKPLPIPTSFLMDPKGRVSVIYKGSHSVDTILKDIEHSKLTRQERFLKSSALDGITVDHPIAIKVGDLQSASMQFRRGVSEEKKGNLKGAEDHYKWATKLVPEYAASQLMLGKLYIRIKKWDEAVKHLELAMKHQPLSNEDRFLLVKTYQQLGEFKKSQEILTTILKKNPSFLPAIFELAAQYARAGKIAQSVNQYEAGLKIDPKNLKALNNLAWLLATSSDEQVRDPDRSFEIATKLVTATNQKNPDTLDTLAAALAAKGKFKEAIKNLEKAIQLLNSKGKKNQSKGYQKRLESYKKNELPKR